MAGTLGGEKGFEQIFVTDGSRKSSFLVREMKTRHDNKTLDQIGRRLFGTEPLPTAEIDDIVTKPDLFLLVREHIAADRTAAIAELRRTSPFRRYLVASSAMGLTAAAVTGAIILSKPEKAIKAPVQVVSSKVPDAVPEVVRPEDPPQPNTGKLSAGRTTKDEIRVEKTILRRSEPVARPQRYAEPDTKFLPVSYTGDPDETSAGGQVIRVEMKRSSLFAIGVDIPLENGDATVKADLLVSRDGVTRAIRVVD